MNRLTVRDLDVRGKRVFVRVDFNCPIGDDGQVSDDTRIVAALPTLRYLSEKGGPKGAPEPRYSMAPVAARLAQRLKLPVVTAGDCIGADVEAAATALPEGGFLMLENLRFHPGEETNDPEFARALARSADLYVNDAFGTAHRAHASTVGITRFLSPSAAGFLMEKELKYLGQ
ncbi:MAG: phosphoglycerate kinase, partial [bacterium]